MSKIEMKVNPEVLLYYIKNSNFNIEYLEKQTNLHNLNKWIKGEKDPTFNQLNMLSKKLNIPLGYLVISQPHKENIPLLEYRTVNSVENESVSRELIDTIKVIKNRQEFVSEYKKDRGQEGLNYVGKFTIDSSIEEMVAYTRELLNIDLLWQKNLNNQSPLKYFREKINDIGTLVFLNGVFEKNTRRKLDIEEFRAFVIVDEYAPAIFINTNDSKNAQLFSLLHEFAHILFGIDELYNITESTRYSVSNLEQKCNKFAAEILVPNAEFIKKYKVNKEIHAYDLVELAKYFKVSKTVIARRALINQYISIKKYREIAEENHEEYIEEKKRKKENDGNPNYWNVLQFKMDPTFFKTVSNSYYEGKTQFSDTLNILGLNRRAFDKLEDIYKKGVKK